MAKTLSTTPGQILLKQILPEEVWHVFEKNPIDKKSIVSILSYIAEKHPEQYKDTLQKLHEFGEEAAYFHGGRSSLSLADFQAPPEIQVLKQKLSDQIDTIREDPNLSEARKQAKIISALKKAKDGAKKILIEKSPNGAFTLQLLSGSRGSEEDLMNLVGGVFHTVGQSGEDIDVPVYRSFAEGLDPAEYWTTSYGSRLGFLGTKFATPVAGHIANQLILAGQRLRVTEKDCGTENGILVDASDPDYEGAVLARDYGPLAKRGQPLTPKLMRSLKNRDNLVVRSPITCETEHGICQKCAGKMPDYPNIGDFIGVSAIQATTEPLSQAQIGLKHHAKRVVGGLDAIQQLLDVPGTFPGGAAIARKSGFVSNVSKTPVGGNKITIGKEEYLLEPGLEPIVKPGQEVEAGEVLSTGLPNPANIAQYRGLGAARRKFIDIFSDALNNTNIRHNKRNLAYISRGIINHALITEPFQEYLPGDIVEFSAITRRYEPRDGALAKRPKMAIGHYLEKPALHHTIGTRITRRMARDLSNAGFSEVLVHKNPPPFQPMMRRSLEATRYSKDFLDRMGGFYLRRSLLDALYSGTTRSDPTLPTAVIPQIVLRGEIEQLK